MDFCIVRIFVQLPVLQSVKNVGVNANVMTWFAWFSPPPPHYKTLLCRPNTYVSCRYAAHILKRRCHEKSLSTKNWCHIYCINVLVSILSRCPFNFTNQWPCKEMSKCLMKGLGPPPRHNILPLVIRTCTSSNYLINGYTAQSGWWRLAYTQVQGEETETIIKTSNSGNLIASNHTRAYPHSLPHTGHNLQCINPCLL